MNRWIAALGGITLLGIVLLGMMLIGDSQPPLPVASATPSASALETDGPSPSAAPTQAPPPATTGAMPSDFNGDGFADLVIGVPWHTVGELAHAGAVHVLYGSIDGLTRSGVQLWTRDTPDVLGTAEAIDEFGASLASGDFDRDGYADLAVGAPDGGFGSSAGGVNVLFGSPSGLTSADNELWMIADLPGVPGNVNGGGRLGTALSSGDFDGDGFADLAIGAPGLLDNDMGWAGVVVLLQGGAEGLEFRGNWLARAHTDPPSYPEFHALGDALASGDLNGDGRDDLAASTFGGRNGGGEVDVFYGSETGLTAEGSQRWRQNSPGLGRALWPDKFGAALAIGDFDADGFDDLAAADPSERLDCGSRCSRAGTVSVLRGSASGLTADGMQLWTEDTPGVPGNAERKDRFGFSLAAGDFDGDGADDLAVGAPGEDRYARRPWGTGAVTVLYGSLDGLTTSRAERWTRDSPGVPGDAEPDEAFGESLASAQFDGSAMNDLVIGVPRERLPGVGHVGVVIVLHGRSGGLNGQGAQEWSKALLGIDEAPEDEHFGEVLGP